MGRRPLIAAVVLVLAGACVFLAVNKPWVSVSSQQAARALEQHLPTKDRYVCNALPGVPVAGEPDWTYECVDTTDPQRSGYFVLVHGGRVATIQPSG
jgi:hypothetical protein